MEMSQTQLLRLLADAMDMLKKDLIWGVTPKGLCHSIGRIGEIYAAILSGGQLPVACNQPGYDVIGEDGARITVKTFTVGGAVIFNEETLHMASRAIIAQLLFKGAEPRICLVLDCPVSELMPLMRGKNGKLQISVRRLAELAGKIRQSECPIIEGNAARSLAWSRGVEALKGAAHHPLPALPIADDLEPPPGYHARRLPDGQFALMLGRMEIPRSSRSIRRIARQIGVDRLNERGNRKTDSRITRDVLEKLLQDPRPA